MESAKHQKEEKGENLVMEKLKDSSPPSNLRPPPPFSPSQPSLSSSTSGSSSDIEIMSMECGPYRQMAMVDPGFSTSANRPTAKRTSSKMRSTYGQYVLVIPRAPNRTTTNEKDGERVPKEDVICRICFKEFEEENVLKLNCLCRVTFIHENCEIVWSREKSNNKCDVCGQELEKTPITFIPANPSTPVANSRKVKMKCNCFPRFI